MERLSAGMSERFLWGGFLVEMTVLTRGADAVPVDDWSYMEYTLNPAADKNQQITDNAFE